MRWINCPSHRGRAVKKFMSQHFSDSARQVLLVGGAGFDPRACILPVQLDSILGNRLKTLLLKEERPEKMAKLVTSAENNQRNLADKLTNVVVEPINILSEDLSVIGGRLAVGRLAQELPNGYTDVVIDLSALSSGIGFPLIRYALEWADQQPKTRELHILLVMNPAIDHSIHALPLDKSKDIFGFKGNFGLAGMSEAAKLWLPQLAYDQRDALIRIYDEVRPDDVCPILPFPSTDPRAGDRLLEHFGSEILDTWEVAPQNVIFAAEGNPLDLYRTLLRIDDERKVVFEETGGSQIILTPTGSKALAIGALMAAMERDLPVRYVESMGYCVDDWNKFNQTTENDLELLHLWLGGEPYSNPNGASTG